MVKIEYENRERLPFMVEVKEEEALDTIIKITSEGGGVYWVERKEGK